MREIGRIYAALDPADDGKVPFLEGNEALFESIPVDAGAWLAFEKSTLCEEVAGLDYGGLIGTYEEAWFEEPQLPALSVVLERAGTAPPEAQAFVTELAAFVRRAHTRGVGITLAIGG